MNKKSGFTLIELVVVIVILGILAVTAAPRFLNLQDDARQARLEGMRGAMASAFDMGYGKLAIAGLEHKAYVSNKTADSSGDGPYDLPFDHCGSGDYCVFRYGYPDADQHSLIPLLPNLAQTDSDWQIKVNPDDSTEVLVYEQGNKDTSQCSIRYAAPSSDTSGYRMILNPCD
ncbi:type II secretion system protein [Vibrio rotiferianus]|uniref:type II secretion system protein n=1 Tax=Vibrio rotiferianus TaxID=190895 RepID=UPI000B5A101D|nr:type II secretion system protein [Vibrio rotiferianus]ASI93531.1 MSHA biogenesis protein MshA [Vibrio rotiferianus]